MVDSDPAQPSKQRKSWFGALSVPRFRRIEIDDERHARLLCPRAKRVVRADQLSVDLVVDDVYGEHAAAG